MEYVAILYWIAGAAVLAIIVADSIPSLYKRAISARRPAAEHSKALDNPFAWLRARPSRTD